MEPEVEPNWVSLNAVELIHNEQLSTHGGASGIRDQGMLESAIARPLNRYHYDPGATLFDLAACYGFGLAMNHPFVDGNKRAAFTTCLTFLYLNGNVITASLADRYTTFLRLAAGELSEEELAAWLRDNSAPRPDAPNPSA